MGIGLTFEEYVDLRLRPLAASDAARPTPPHEALYWRFGTQWAARSGDWKLLQAREGRGGSIQIAKQGPVRLFNLSEDIGEENDLAAAEPEKVRQLRAMWDAWDAQLPKPYWQPLPVE